MIGIIGAMNEEIIELKSLMKDNIVTKKEGEFEFFLGNILGKEIVLVECGIGKVNAAICTTLLKSIFKVEKIIFTGVAGGLNPNIKFSDIVIGTDMIEHDFDVVASFGYEPGQIPGMKEYVFKSDEFLVEIAYKAAVEKFGEQHVIKGRILSGDQFISSSDKVNYLIETFNGDCVEMEGAAVAHTCYSLNVPFIIIRSISDKADSGASLDFKKFVKIAAKNSKTIVEGILGRL